jgi:hypothetical protein
LQVGPAIAIITSKALRSKTAHVVVYATKSIAHDVCKTATYEARAGCETVLCTWFLGGKDVEAEDCLHKGILGSCKGEVEEESPGKSLWTSMIEIHCL